MWGPNHPSPGPSPPVHAPCACRQVAEAAARRSDIAEALGACPQWPGWAASVLKPRNERDNLMHWACGRPSASDMHGMAEDSPAGVMVSCCQSFVMLSGSNDAVASVQQGKGKIQTKQGVPCQRSSTRFGDGRARHG